MNLIFSHISGQDIKNQEQEIYEFHLWVKQENSMQLQMLMELK